MNGRFFRLLRRLNGDTQATAAKRFGITQSAVSKLETGEIHSLDRRHLPTARAYALKAVQSLLKPLGMAVWQPLK